MKTFDHVIVFGASSSIAGYVIPEIKKLSDSVKLIYRSIPADEGMIPDSNFTLIEFNICDDSQNIADFAKNIGIQPSESILILNFIGHFGEVQNLANMTPGPIIKTTEVNLVPFLHLIRMLKNASEGSALIGFSGGGVGGSNLERTSLGYLASKGAMGFICEAISSEFEGEGKSISLIAPGPFPSRMQEAVANSVFPEFEESRQKSVSIMKSEVSATKLIRMISWIASNPKHANGRIWSALHDDPSSINDVGNHGRLRRVQDN